MRGKERREEGHTREVTRCDSSRPGCVRRPASSEASVEEGAEGREDEGET